MLLQGTGHTSTPPCPINWINCTNDDIAKAKLRRCRVNKNMTSAVKQLTSKDYDNGHDDDDDEKWAEDDGSSCGGKVLQRVVFCLSILNIKNYDWLRRISCILVICQWLCKWS